MRAPKAGPVIIALVSAVRFALIYERNRAAAARATST